QDLYFNARELPPVDRSRFLRGACNDPDIQHEVESLLECGEQAERFLDGSAIDVLAAMYEADAFDLEAENDAETTTVHPHVWTAHTAESVSRPVHNVVEGLAGRQFGSYKFLSLLGSGG